MLDLVDPRCARVEVAGGKGAGLSRAKAAGLPVLAGVVLPPSAVVTSLRAGAAALRSSGSGGARRAVMAQGLPEELRVELRDAVVKLGGDVIVRSSANVESSGEWSGAFSSFDEIGVEDVDVAVRGCLASAFGVEVVERDDHVGHGADGPSMAVLIQPRVEPSVAGLARAGRAEGTVIESVVGSPAALMAGWTAGQRTTVDQDGTVHAVDDPVLSAEQATAVADLLAQVVRVLGHAVIEWAVVDGQLVLLQSTSAPVPSAERPERFRAGLTGLDHPRADSVVRLAVAFPGGLSEELVLPWALALPDPGILDLGAPTGATDLDLAWARSEALALTQMAWGGEGRDVLERCRDVMRGLRGDDPAPALRTLDDLDSPDPERAHGLLVHLLRAGRGMTQRGRLRRPEEIFGCETHEVLHDLGQLRQSWAGARRWEPFLAGVGETRGTAYEGMSASGGVGAGHVLAVRSVTDLPATRPPRSVIVAPFPVPGLASMLWDAAALVTVGGSAGAHLVEVARSLGVPAVVGCEELPLVPGVGDMLAVVDGDVGRVSLHPVGPRLLPTGGA